MNRVGTKIIQSVIWLAVAGVMYFLIRQAFFTAGQVDVEAFVRLRPSPLILSGLGFLVTILWWGTVWYFLLPAHERKNISFPQALKIHLYAWLARYIPGKVAMILGKVQAGMQAGLSKRAVLMSTGYEQILQIVSGIIVGSLLVGFSWFEVYGSIWGLLLMISVSAIAVLCLHPKIFYPVVNTLLLKLGRNPLDQNMVRSFPVLLGIVGLYALGQLVNGISFFLMVKAVYPVMNGSILLLAGSYSLAGVIGILALIVPSGLGVREGVITALVSSILPLSISAQLAILARLISTGVDGILGLILGIKWLFDKEGAVRWLEVIIYALGAIFLLVLPLIYTGSYIDEYWHIFAGKDLLNTGSFAEIYTSGPYIRGSYVSGLAGIIQALVPGSLYALKLIPIFVSFGIWAIWWDISRKLVPGNTWFRIVFFLLWISSPWLILNHTYIRMYVFYELMLALAVWITIKLWNVTSWKWYLYAALSVLGYGLFVYLSFDSGAYMVLLALLLGLGMTFVSQKELPIKRIWRQGSTVLIIGVAAMTPFIQQLIQRFLTLDLRYGTTISYQEFFTGDGMFYTTAFGLVGVLIAAIRLPKARFLGLGLITLVIIHTLLPIEAQLIRAIFYLFPAIYFFVALGLIGKGRSNAKLEIISRTLFAITFGFILTAQSYPPTFWQGPNIPGEINYIDYAKAYQYANDNCQNQPIFETSPTPYLGEFYGVEATPVVTRTDWMETDKIFSQSEGEWYVNYHDKQVITNLDNLPENYCWIRRKPSLGNYLSDTSVTGQLTEFLAIEIIEK